jgi:hypothetical protein
MRSRDVDGNMGHETQSTETLRIEENIMENDEKTEREK